MNFLKIVVISIFLAMTSTIYAAGKHEGDHVEPPVKMVCTTEHATMGHCEMPKTIDSNCTPEHAAMGHCEMSQHDDGDHQHNGHQSIVGKPVDGSVATQTVNVEMLDTMRYVFDQEFEIKPDKIIQFVVTNKGKIAHEFSISTEQERVQHAEMMSANPGMVHNDKGGAIMVEPSETKSLTWKFTASDEEVVFACSIAGHFEAGMFHMQPVVRQ